MHRIYTAEALNNAPFGAAVIKNALKVRKATNTPQYGEVTLKSRQNSCLNAAIPSVKSKPTAIAPEQLINKTDIIRVINRGMEHFIRVVVNYVSRHLNLRFWYFQIILFFTFSATTFASSEFGFNPKKRIETVIAANELNRIGVLGGEIVEVIGDENKYALYWSGDFRHLFIKPKVEAGETIELSLIIPQGNAQDIRFTVGDTAARTIFINVGSEITSSIPSSGVRPSTNPQLKSEIAGMMRVMIENEKGKYYVTNVKRTLKQSKQMLVTQALSYRYRNLSGGVLSVKNLTSKPLNLFESDFSNLFKNTVAINFESNVIKPRGTIRVFIVTKEGEHD